MSKIWKTAGLAVVGALAGAIAVYQVKKHTSGLLD